MGERHLKKKMIGNKENDRGRSEEKKKKKIEVRVSGTSISW